MLTRNSDTVKHVGKGLESVPNKRLVLTWGNVADAADATGHSRVAIDIETAGKMVRLTVMHKIILLRLYFRRRHHLAPLGDVPADRFGKLLRCCADRFQS